MADSSAKSTNKKKRKLTNLDDNSITPKKHSVGVPEKRKEVDVGKASNAASPPWSHLQLILSLQSNEIDLQKKVELALDYVNSREKGVNEWEEDSETVNVSRLLVFLNDWVQPVLFSHEKKVRVESVLIEGYLDYRCWQIFKFCLEESLRLQIQLNLSGELLKSFRFIARNILSLLTDTSLSSTSFAFTGDGFKLYSLVLDCASFVFLSHVGLANEKLDSWFETVSDVLELLHVIFQKNLDGDNAGVFTLRFSCLLLEPFAKFLKVHPARKEKYKVFVDKLVETLLYLLGVLHLHADARTGSLLTVVQEVLLQGLFHSVHIDGYLGLRSLEKYSPSNDGKVNYLKTSTESYHRHFFNKLESIVASKKSELSGLGELFHLLVDKVRKQRKLSLAEKTEGSKHLSDVEPSKDSYGSSHFTADRRKSLWNFFVWIMEHLLREMEVGPPLMDAFFTLKSINSLLAYLLDEKLYIKTEDFSEGACLSFLKRVCNTVSSFSTHLCSLYVHDTVGESQEIIIMLGKEVLVAMRYFLDIEYDILGNELSSLWLMVLSYFALGHSLRDVPNHCLLATQALGFGCYLIKFYSELRQVEKIILALLEAVRCIMMHEDNGYRETSFGSFINIPPSEAYAKSVQMLLCEHEFKLAVSKSIKSLPEMQVSECIMKLRDDLAKSIEWMQSYCSVTDGIEYPESNTKKHSMLFQNVETELFGGGLSELYALIIDSLTVTAGNSSLVGKYVNKLIAVLSPFMSVLAGQPHGISEFLVFVAGKSSNKEDSGNKSMPMSFGASTHWIFVFFFRLYISCRSLYRQTITFMPPDKLRKMPANMLDCFATYTGNDLIKRIEWIKEEYFSLAVQPSASLLAVINSVSDICMCGSTTGNWPLIYVFHVMVLQRLVDLNRQIMSSKYMLQRNSRIKAESLDDASHLSALSEEAENLAEFITSRLSFFVSDKMSVCSNDDETGSLNSYASRGWDFGVASLNEDSGPIAIWWILCQNVDVWSPHASKKKLKKFLSLVLCTSLPFISRGCTKGKSYKTDEAGFLNKINVHQISSDLLATSVFYEQPLVHKHLASAFCCLLKKSVLPIFSDLSFENLDLKTSPDWEDILGKNDSLLKVVSRNQPVVYDMQLEGKTVSSLHVKLLADIPMESAGLKFIACQSLLSLLSWIPKGCMTSKSLSVYVTCLLNLERYVIKSLLERRDALSLDYQYQLLRFLVSCRKVLKVIIKGFCENRIFQSSIIPVLSEDLFTVLWLFKSVNLVIGLQDVLSQYQADQVRERICSLMDHTSQLFLILNKHYFNCAFERCASDGSDSRMVSLENSIGWKLAECLKEQTEGVLIHLKEVLGTEKEGTLVNMVNIESVPSILSCLSGFLWGLISALDNIQAIDNDKMEIFSLLFEHDSKLKLCIDEFAELISFVSNMLFDEDAHRENGSFDAHYNSHGLPSSEKLQSGEVPSVASVLSKPDTYQCTLLSNCLLQRLLEGNNPQAAIIIRQLLTASSALLRLNLKTNCTPAVSSLVPLYIDICQVLLVKLADLSEVPKLSSFLWLDGVLSYLQELWCHFPSNINSESSRNVYTSLIEMQLNALGMCISLQRKEATLASYMTQSRSKILSSEEESISHLSLFLDEFKARLRMSIDALLRRSSDSHRQSAVHVIMRALVGLNHGCAKIYNLNTGSRHGGTVSPCVAAGIDCLDLLVEHVSGGRKLDVSESIQSVISALFNIVIHLQSPLVYYSATSCTVPKGPDPGAVILMSVEVLTRISGKHALFRMNHCHVALSLRMPSVIFQDFCQVRESETFYPVDNRDSDIVVDKQFLIALFGACCRLLSTTLRHHKRESEQSIALLQESVRVLLHCLETLDSDSTSRNPYFQMGVQEGVKFSCSLRRIYEELRQQKEDFGKHCFKFLSDYILVYSGIGPLKTGIRREVDEALKPGVYALVDCCSADDLQHLHSVYGEGPCRNTLASLQQDYKFNFQYEGKV